MDIINIKLNCLIALGSADQNVRAQFDGETTTK